MEGVPFATARRTSPSIRRRSSQLANDRGVPISGKDFKTGQTWMKTVIAPGLKARMLGLAGWYSTNILGNRDGEVLDDPASFKTKEESKLSVLHTILQPEIYPDLYKEFSHVVRINYYPPRGDNKEGWDNIDIVGWMGYPMQIKVNFLCRDSILAAPIVLDLALFSDFAQRAGHEGDSGMAILLLQEPDGRCRDSSRSTICSFSRRSSRTRSGTSWARSRSRTSAWSTTPREIRPALALRFRGRGFRGGLPAPPARPQHAAPDGRHGASRAS